MDTFFFLQADQVAAEIQEDLAAMLSARPPQLRLIAAAEQPLGELARRGRYREDLAAVLSTITIELPPLAQSARGPAALGPGVPRGG